MPAMSGLGDVRRATSGSCTGFYDGFAADYELAYGGGWDSAVEQQGAGLDQLIQGALPGARDVLDCSCGIGTQAIGLARLGYRVSGTDVSEGAIDRARREAERLGASVSFGLADFRDLSSVSGVFDSVISCDNAIPHLLDEEDVPKALGQMRAKLRLGGLLVLTMRDFDRALIERPVVAPPVIVPGPPRRVLLRLHDWDEDRPFYTVRFLVLTQTESGWAAVEHTTRHRAITRDELTQAALAADFRAIAWLPTGQIEGLDQQVMTAIGQ